MAASTYDDIKTLVANVYELALFTAQEGNVIAPPKGKVDNNFQ